MTGQAENPDFEYKTLCHVFICMNIWRRNVHSEYQCKPKNPIQISAGGEAKCGREKSYGKNWILLGASCLPTLFNTWGLQCKMETKWKETFVPWFTSLTFPVSIHVLAIICTLGNGKRRFEIHKNSCLFTIIWSIWWLQRVWTIVMLIQQCQPLLDLHQYFQLIWFIVWTPMYTSSMFENTRLSV